MPPLMQAPENDIYANYGPEWMYGTPTMRREATQANAKYEFDKEKLRLEEERKNAWLRQQIASGNHIAAALADPERFQALTGKSMSFDPMGAPVMYDPRTEGDWLGAHRESEAASRDLARTLATGEFNRKQGDAAVQDQLGIENIRRNFQDRGAPVAQAMRNLNPAEAKDIAIGESQYSKDQQALARQQSQNAGQLSVAQTTIQPGMAQAGVQGRELDINAPFIAAKTETIQEQNRNPQLKERIAGVKARLDAFRSVLSNPPVSATPEQINSWSLSLEEANQELQALSSGQPSTLPSTSPTTGDSPEALAPPEKHKQGEQLRLRNKETGAEEVFVLRGKRWVPVQAKKTPGGA